MKAHTSQDKTNRKCLSELIVKPSDCYAIPPLDQWPGRNISQEDQKHSAEESECHGKGWNSMIPEVLWAYQTAFKTPIGQTPHQLIYGKTCHIPVDLEFRSHGAVKRWNMYIQWARVKRQIQWAELDEWRKKAYHNSKLYKEQMKRWQDKRIQIKHFKVGNKVFFSISRLHLFGLVSLKSKWEGPCLVNPPGQWREYIPRARTTWTQRNRRLWVIRARAPIYDHRQTVNVLYPSLG